MSDLIDRQALLDECLNHYEVGNIEQNCTMDWICKTVRNFPAASPWHRVDEELPALKELVPRYFASGMCVLYNADTESFDTGFATKLEFGDAEMDWKALYVKNPTHWMPIELPDEDADANE